MQMIGPFRNELRCRTNERRGRRSLKYVDGRKATNAAAARGQSLPLPRSGLVQQDLSVIRIGGKIGGGHRESSTATAHVMPMVVTLIEHPVLLIGPHRPFSLTDSHLQPSEHASIGRPKLRMTQSQVTEYLAHTVGISKNDSTRKSGFALIAVHSARQQLGGPHAIMNTPNSVKPVKPV